MPYQKYISYIFLKKKLYMLHSSETVHTDQHFLLQNPFICIGHNTNTIKTQNGDFVYK